MKGFRNPNIPPIQRSKNSFEVKLVSPYGDISDITPFPYYLIPQVQAEPFVSLTIYTNDTRAGFLINLQIRF